jgi:hypothetical protein
LDCGAQEFAGTDDNLNRVKKHLEKNPDHTIIAEITNTEV